MLLLRVDFVLIQPFLLACLNLVVLVLTSIFKHISVRKQRRLVSKQGRKALDNIDLNQIVSFSKIT